MLTASSAIEQLGALHGTTLTVTGPCAWRGDDSWLFDEREAAASAAHRIRLVVAEPPGFRWLFKEPMTAGGGGEPRAAEVAVHSAIITVRGRLRRSERAGLGGGFAAELDELEWATNSYAPLWAGDDTLAMPREHCFSLHGVHPRAAGSLRVGDLLRAPQRFFGRHVRVHGCVVAPRDGGGPAYLVEHPDDRGAPDRRVRVERGHLRTELGAMAYDPATPKIEGYRLAACIVGGVLGPAAPDAAAVRFTTELCLACYPVRAWMYDAYFGDYPGMQWRE